MPNCYKITFFLFFLISISLLWVPSDVEHPSDMRLQSSEFSPLTLNAKHYLEWNQTWGGMLGDTTNGVATDYEGNVYIVGVTDSFAGNLFLLKYNRTGGMQWSRIWNRTTFDTIQDIAIDLGGNCIMVGATEMPDDVILFKYDSDGNQVWNQTWGIAANEVGETVAVDNSSDIYIAGQVNFGGNLDAFLAKFNSTGHLQWNVTFESTPFNNDYGQGVAVDSEAQAVYLAGYSGDGPHAFLVKYHLNGSLDWSRIYYKGIGETGRGVATDKQHNIYLLGTSRFPTPNRDVLLAKYNVTGHLLWDTRWGGPNDEGVGDAVAVGPSGSVYFSCYQSIGEYYNIHTVKYSPDGTSRWNKTWDYSDEDVSQSLTTDLQENIYVGGLINNTFYDALVIKYGIDSDNDTVTDDLETYQYGTNASNPDSDADHIPDGAEILLNFDPLNASDGLADYDNDLLLNYEEYAAGANMTDADTDADGLGDGAEVHFYGTDPCNPDTDRDSFSDGEEIAKGTDPLDPTSYPIEGIPSFQFAIAFSAMLLLFSFKAWSNRNKRWMDHPK